MVDVNYHECLTMDYNARIYVWSMSMMRFGHKMLHMHRHKAHGLHKSAKIQVNKVERKTLTTAGV